MSVISLQSLLTPEKVVEVDYPGFEGFKLKVAFLSREEIIKIRKKCTVTKFDKRTRQPVDELDEELFLKTYVSAIIKGWSGLKFKYLQDLMLVDLSTVEDVEKELEYNQDNALVLMKNSQELDGFVTDITSNLANFTKYSSAS
jgi:hypothetical protein